MLGLLAVTQTACGSSSDDTEAVESKDDLDAIGSESGGQASGGSQAQSSGGETAQGSGTGGDTSDGGMGGGAPVEGVYSTKIIVDLSLEDFTEMCDEAGGHVETHATCGGVVSGKGFSYDDVTYAFTEHTCAGYNTCSGFSCVLDD